MSNTPKISVLIPTYNYAQYLDEAIQSVIDQTYSDFELIIVDNNSTDNTDEVVRKYLYDGRISYYKNETNIGMVANFNKCLEYSKGEYIKYLLADDKFHPELLEKFVTIMEQYHNVSLVTSYRKFFDAKSGENVTPFIFLQEGKKVIYDNLKRGNWIGEPTAPMFRRLNLKVGNFNSNYIWLTDIEMWLRQLTVGDCYIIPEYLSYIRKHHIQITKAVKKNFIHFLEDYYFYKSIKEHKEYNINFSEFDIDPIIKKKAANCAKAMYKVIPELGKKEKWSIFKKAFKIAYTEGVLFTPLINYVAKSTTRNNEST
ncbi:MAG: glycosyltransferase family 2 protein [Parafilimonas sp.]